MDSIDGKKEILDLQLVILPGQNPPVRARKYYDLAYICWKKTWEDASRELTDIPSKMYANDFLRQDEVLALFDGVNCTSLGFWTELDMSVKSSREDMYFQSWNEYSLNALTKNGTWIGKYSYLTVAKEYRKSFSDLGYSFKDIQIGVFVMRFLNSQANAMTGTTRNNKGVNQVCARGGAKLIESGLKQHGVEIDVMAWYRDSACPWSEINSTVTEIWSNRIDFTNSKTSKSLKNIEEKNEIRKKSSPNV